MNNKSIFLGVQKNGKQNEKKRKMNPQQEPAPNFTWKARTFADEKSFENSLCFDDDGNFCAGKDSLQLVGIRPGLYVVSIRANPKLIPRWYFDTEEASVIGFSFYLSGKLECIQERELGKKPVSTLCQCGVNFVTCLHGAKGYSHYLSDEILNAVAIYVDRQMFTDLVAEELGAIPKDCRSLLQQKNFSFSLPMTRDMYNTAAHAFHHPFQGTAARLHLEGCGLELLALQIDQLFRQDLFREKHLRRCDEERIRMAGDILIQKMECPPTIPELALQVGMNSAKLQKEFKQVFGTTIGQFLVQQRMACARELLLAKDIDVTQAALAVGYSNVSYFIRCYKKAFGITPGCLNKLPPVD